MNILLISLCIGILGAIIYNYNNDNINNESEDKYKIKLGCVCIGITFISFIFLTYSYSNKQELISTSDINQLGTKINNIKPPF